MNYGTQPGQRLHITNWKDPPCLMVKSIFLWQCLICFMGKSTISTGSCSIAMLVITRGYEFFKSDLLESDSPGYSINLINFITWMSENRGIQDKKKILYFV